MWLLKSSGLMQILIQISQTAQSRTELFFWTIKLFDIKPKTEFCVIAQAIMSK